MFSDTDAKSIVALHKETSVSDQQERALKSLNNASAAAKPPPAIKTAQYQVGGTSSRFLPIPKAVEIPLFTYTPEEIEFSGPYVPSLEDFEGPSQEYLAFIRAATPAELAAGFHSKLACRRALLDAFSDIWYQPKTEGNQFNPFEGEQEQMEES